MSREETGVELAEYRSEQSAAGAGLRKRWVEQWAMERWTVDRWAAEK